MIYPELFADVPLDADGSFSLDAADVVGSLDGLHVLGIFLKPIAGRPPLDPDSLRVNVGVP
jgi:hypothetical protein